MTMNNAKMALPVGSPIVTTYTQHAHLLSILSNYKDTQAWIYSNYINLYIYKNYKHNWSDFYFPLPYELRPSDTCKWVLTQKINRDSAERKWGSILNFIIENINSGNYVHMMLNYYHIPFSERYHKMNLHHDIFIYGYDLENKILQVSDFFKYGKYTSEELHFDDFMRSYSTNDTTKNPDYLNGMIYLYSYNKNCDYKFHISNVTNSIKAYLFGITPEYWEIYNNENRESIEFGIKIYDTLHNYVSWKLENNDFLIDLRPFYLLYDHKQIMISRIKFLYENGYFPYDTAPLDTLEEISSQIQKISKLIMKSIFSKDTSMKTKIINGIDSIPIKEFDSLRRFT